MTDHHYALGVTWQGNLGTGTSGYRDYSRDCLLTADGKPDLLGSSDVPFRGDGSRWNPEELLLAALSQCHLLSYLHSAVNHGIVVTAYADAPVGTMSRVGQGGHFTSVVLRPRVTITDPTQVELARAIHREASENCFIAASVNFPVTHEPETVLATA
ncbi:OsmC family protein [Nocardioides pelophilus]|uniref:OsmC family protein n=1 Tax=Nocardioides pelophilus TaxID=2172019 RepID=UPI00160197BD|nr:OsmC family protein [Nocardioides pelophilus]